jgi:hypothetical protein
MELMSFINNAKKYGHELDFVVVAYTIPHKKQTEDNIKSAIPFYAVDINNPAFCNEQMQQLGLPKATIRTLLNCPVDTKAGLVPYGFNRMIVITEAILRGADVLFFIDSDIVPSVLKKTPDGNILEEVDFFKAHLDQLNAGADVTTGEYSGYNILPPATFDGMSDFLAGVQKFEMLHYWQTSGSHRCLVFQQENVTPKPCNKILGGNMAIKLSAFKKLPPFFSSYYTLGGELFLCRGEDTVLGAEMAHSGVSCIDIGLNPMHYTYSDYPAEPDLKNDPSVQNRFYYACTGWVGRNPLLNYILGKDLYETREYQREQLERGLKALSEYTSNPRFNTVLKNFDVSWDSLDRYIKEFENAYKAWKTFVELVDIA